MTPATLLPLLLGLAVVAAWVRLGLRHVRAPGTERGPAWRLVVLLALQPLVAGLLYRTLVPPRVTASGTLVVATRGAPPTAALTGDPIVALPEAPAVPGAERVPDLATALRRHAPARLRVVGDGLTARDRDAAQGLPLDFTPPRPAHGLVRLDPPAPVAAGATFAVGGRVSGPGSVDLVDPAGRVVDHAVPDAAGDFVVTGTARAAGPATFTLRIRDGAATVATAAVPVWTLAPVPARVFLLAAAPGPEVKYLRRWASDGGLAIHAEIATGGGVDLGDAPLPLTAATLAASDLAILDLRSWAALPPAARATVAAAVRSGLGLVVRIDGPVTDAARGALRPLGFAVAGGDDTAPLALPAPTGDDAVRLARRGPGTPDDPATADRGDALPVLARWNVTVAAPAASPLVRDARGATVAVWRAEGAGRVALWPVADSYRLVLAGAGDTYDALWRTVVTTVGRGRGAAAPTIAGPARVGERVVLCGLGLDASVVAPDGRTTPLFADPPGSGCAGYWPRGVGWHRLHQGGGDRPFFVAAASALPDLRTTDDAAATRALAAGAPAATDRPAATQPGSPWPWFLGWLAVSAALWWFERARQRRADDE